MPKSHYGTTNSNFRHGGCKTAEYKTWESIKNRCYNPHKDNYHRYGGRGITMAEAWRNDFKMFLRDVGPRPGAGYSIERIDNSGNYVPGNVRWATAKQQARNTRRNRIVCLDEHPMTVAEAAERLGLSYNTLWGRMARAKTNIVRQVIP
jgi:hypothetical protein